jgi:phenylpropionate dioxygenase-like ring-hydroxylating dioxygenase large terminal subunit
MTVQFDPGLPDGRFPFPAYPNGWSRVGLTDELAAGDVRPIRYFGRDLVLFRTESGCPRVLDAHCRHLGAHLGHGGKVDGEGLRCPFHAWCWDGEGRCTDIPYAERIPKNARIGAWPVCERNGFIFMFHDAESRPPEEEVPEIPEYGDLEWTPYERLRWKIRSRLYDMGENAVDDIHFRYLHGAASLPQTVRGDVRGKSSNLSTMKLDTPQGQIEGSIESTGVPGMGLVYVRGICDTLIVITTTPIDGEYVDQMFCYTQKLGEDEGKQRLAAALLRDLEKQINEDIVVFEHKKYLTRPLLLKEDGPIGEYRRTGRNRYSGTFFAKKDSENADGPPPLRPSPKNPPGFGERECDELSSFLRSALRVRRVEKVEHPEAGTVEFKLFGKGDALKGRVTYERACLERNEVTAVRGHLALPHVKKRILDAAAEGVVIPSSEIE